MRGSGMSVVALGVLLCWQGIQPAARVPAAEAQPAVTAIGEAVGLANSLRDLKGNRRSLTGFKDHKAIVIAFLGTECPISNLYLPSLIELERKYRPKQVQFLAVYPNEHEDFDQVAAHAHDRDVPFPVLKDFGQRLADSLNVKRVPTVVVLDGKRMLRYRGRIDDRYGVAFRKESASREDLVQALEEVLADQKVGLAETEADGCLIDRVRKPSSSINVTFNNQVVRILQSRCQNCHRPDQTAPFPLLTYDHAVKHAAMIKEVTTQRRMPPWHADPRYGAFANDRRLTQGEIETLAAWIDGGMPRGDAQDLPKPIDWPSGWLLGKPDAVFTMQEEFEVPADGVLPYKHYIVDTGFEEDRWVRRAEARPGTPSVVHHVVVYILQAGTRRPFSPDGNMSVLVGWAPGDLGTNLPPDVALRIPKGSRLLFELHYTPNGKATKDRSAVGITFAPKPPKFELLMNSFSNEAISLPPHDPHYRADATFRVRADARIVSFVPHMHWRGKDYRYEAILPDGRRETLLSVPRWDFNWQSVYQFKEPVRLPKGSRVHAVAHWDNSSNNPYNPDPSKRVRFGLQTWEEMMVGWIAYVWERPETAEELAKTPISQADLFFDRLDHNADSIITRDELPEPMQRLLQLGGIKVAERMTRQEFAVFFEELRKRFPQSRPNEEKKPEIK